MKGELQKFIPITKIDVERREVWGTATEETPDRDDEIFDYASSKPLVEKWSNSVSKVTDGKSLGNVRAMHQAIAAGKIIEINFDDGAKKIDIGTKIVDDGEWEKCLEGVYTGFSLGGHYVRKWTDPDNKNLKRYTAEPYEVSIVDYPAVPTATFAMVKMGGAVETRSFKKHAARDDFKKVTLPKLLDLAKRFGVESPDVLAKGLYEVSRFAECAQGLIWLQQAAVFERDMEGDDSTVPDEIAASITSLLESLESMTAEEIAEAKAQLQASSKSAKAATVPSTTPAARVPAMKENTFKKIKKAHAEELGGIVDHANAVKTMMGDHVEKLEGNKNHEMAKAIGEMHKGMCTKLEGFQAAIGGLPEDETVSDEQHGEKMAKMVSDNDALTKRAEAAEAKAAELEKGADAALQKAVTESKEALAKMTGERDELAKQLDETLTVCDQLLEVRKGKLTSGSRSGDGEPAAAPKTDPAAAEPDLSKMTAEQIGTLRKAAIRKALGSGTVDNGFGSPSAAAAE